MGASERQRQGGLSLLGLIFMLASVGFVGILAMKIVPTFIEYRAISTAIVTAKAAGTTLREVPNSFDKSAGVTYIDSITGRDLVVSRENGELEVSFAYQKKIPLVGPASLVLDYSGTTARAARADKP